jgi:hypothetical protein
MVTHKKKIIKSSVSAATYKDNINLEVLQQISQVLSSGVQYQLEM